MQQQTEQKQNGEYLIAAPLPSRRRRAGREADDRALPRVPDAAAAGDPQAGVRAEGPQLQGKVNNEPGCIWFSMGCIYKAEELVRA